jgi:hypothetical protein
MACGMHGEKNAYRALVGKPGGKLLPIRPREVKKKLKQGGEGWTD